MALPCILRLISCDSRSSLVYSPLNSQRKAPDPGSAAYFTLVCAFNLSRRCPKFDLAHLPQWVDPSQNAIALQMLVPGCLFVMMAVISDSMYALPAEPPGAGSKASVRPCAQSAT